MTSARAHVLSAIGIAALIGAELMLRAAHLSRALTLAVLCVLAAAGFFGVVAFHMNLREEPRAVRVGFVLPLVFPVLFVAVLVADAMSRGIRP
jgi:hypothetical protein